MIDGLISKATLLSKGILLLFVFLFCAKCVFYFCQDVRKQQQMAQLTKERDHLFETIRTYRLLFETTRQLINEMQGSVHFPVIVFYSETPHEKIVLCLALCFYRIYIINPFCARFDWFSAVFY